MVSCANITLERIRAEIDFGGSLKFSTPDIQSFQVNRSRTQLAATLSISIEVPASTVFPIGQDVVVKAGVKDNLLTIFTGRIYSITANSSPEDATTYIVNMSGTDRFFDLEGQTFSRRQRARGQSTFAAITGINSKAPQKGISTEKRIGSGGTHRVTSTDTNLREHSKLVHTDRVAWDPLGQSKNPEFVEKDDATATNVIEIKPRAVSLAPGISVKFNIEGTTFSSGDVWEVTDGTIGAIVTNPDGTATYTQLALGENTITFTKQSATTTFSGKATAVGIPIHDHSSLGQGGPAFGVYGSE